MCMLFFASTPLVASLKPSTTSGTSSGFVDAAGSSIWIHSAPAAMSPSTFGRMTLTATSWTNAAARVVAVLGGGAQPSLVPVVLVVGPVLHRVGARERDLHDPVGVRTDELELLVVLRPAHRAAARPRPTSRSTCCRRSGRCRAARSRRRTRPHGRTSPCASARRRRRRRGRPARAGGSRRSPPSRLFPAG